MTKEEFNKLHSICKDEWLEIAEKHLYDKTERVAFFLNGCPACHISMLVPDRLNTDREHNCRFCPISAWRSMAGKSGYCGNRFFKPVCHDDWSSYRQWWEDTTLKALWTSKTTKACTRLANLKWTWIPEYADIDLGGII